MLVFEVRRRWDFQEKNPVAARVEINHEIELACRLDILLTYSPGVLCISRCVFFFEATEKDGACRAA